MRRNWTQEEVDYLRNAWGNVRLGLICKNLSRSENSVLQKVYRLHLGAFLENSIYISLKISCLKHWDLIIRTHIAKFLGF